MKQALHLGHLGVAILAARVNVFIDVIFSGDVFYVKNWLKGYELYTIPVDNSTRT